MEITGITLLILRAGTLPPCKPCRAQRCRHRVQRTRAGGSTKRKMIKGLELKEKLAGLIAPERGSKFRKLMSTPSQNERHLSTQRPLTKKPPPPQQTENSG
eukprot:1161366-Pelagomonas_calceolata.AAC.3